MAVTVASFLIDFPEFQGAEDPLIQAKIDAAMLRCPTCVWGTGARRDQGIMVKAAALLARSPYGRQMKLVNKEGGTQYDDDVIKLNRIAAAGKLRNT